MIILIREIPNVEALTNTQEEALERILWAHGRGSQVVWMAVDLARKLESKTCFSKYAKRALIDLKSTSTFTKTLLETEFSFRIVIDFVNRHRMDQNGEELIVGFERVLDDNFLLAPVLLAENEIDAKVYEKFSLAIFSSRKNLNRQYVLKIDPQGGGGPDIVKKYTRYVAERRPFICLVDSDKKHPKGSFGGTCQHFNPYPKGLTMGHYLRVIESHEIENLVPEGLVKFLYPAVEQGVIYSDSRYRNYRRYPDHKNGFTVADAKAQDAFYKDTFWQPFYHHRGRTLICGKFGKLVENTFEFLEENSPKKVLEFLDSEKDCELYHIASVVTNWGLKLKRTLS